MQEVIVYRNPLEAAMWHSLMNNGEYMFPLMVALFVFFIAVLVIGRIAESVYGAFCQPKWVMPAQMAFAFFIGFMVFRGMLI